MRNRSILYLLVGLLLASVLVCAATFVASGNSQDIAKWALFQRKTPLLWMVDGCAVIILLGSWLFGATIENQTQSRSGVGSQSVAALMDRIVDLEELSREQAGRIETLESSGSDWHDGFDQEAARLTEHAFLALSDNIEANARQLETINMALRYQRAEMKSLRVALKTGELSPEGDAPSLDSGPRPPRAVTPQLKKLSKTDDPVAELQPAAEVIAVEPEPETAAEDTAVVTEEENFSDQSAESADELDESVDTGDEISDQTVNAGATASVSFDIEKDRKEKQSAAMKAEAAANEFNQSKQPSRSIFRQKRH